MKSKSLITRIATGMIVCISILISMAFVKNKTDDTEKKTSENYERKDTNITITVDTENINEENYMDMIVFSDDRGDSIQKPGDPTNFVSTVSRNKKVYWTGVTKETTDKTIDIYLVYLKENDDADIVDKLFKSSTKKGVYEAKIKNKRSTKVQAYSVVVNILQQDSVIASYDVDPKLKMALAE